MKIKPTALTAIIIAIALSNCNSKTDGQDNLSAIETKNKILGAFGVKGTPKYSPGSAV